MKSQRFGPTHFKPSGNSIVASSIIIPILHLPIPGQKFACPTSPPSCQSPSNGLELPSTRFLAMSHHPSEVLLLACNGIIAHQSSVPGSSSLFPVGNGGCTRSKSRPTYFAAEVDMGKLGRYEIGLYIAEKKGARDGSDSMPDKSAS
jgi:hypothetical protein